MLPDRHTLDDATFIPSLVQEVLGEPMFFELAACLELGPWDSSQGQYHRFGCLTAREEAYWALARLLEELRPFWMSSTVVQTANWLTQPAALDALFEVVDESADYYLLSDRVRLAQRLAASALTECLTSEGTKSTGPKIFLSYKALCQYLRSDAAISDFMDLAYGLQGTITIEKEIDLALTWCCEQLRAFWSAPPVARSLHWLTHDQNILVALAQSEHCGAVESPERISFVFCLVATCVERTEY